MKWKRPPAIKIYEALGALADERVKISGNTAEVVSSTGNKTYDVSYDPQKREIMSNDNGSYWQGYLGYPAIAFLLKTHVLTFRPEFAELLKGIPWKDINTRFKNDFDKTLAHVIGSLEKERKVELEKYVESVEQEIGELHLHFLGSRKKPPKEY